MPAAISSRSCTSASSARPRCARRKSSSWSKHATASTPRRWCARSKRRESAFRFFDRIDAGLFGFVESPAEAGFAGPHHAIDVAVLVRADARILAGGEVLAGAAMVAGVVHVAVADRLARFHLAERAAFGILVGAAVHVQGVVVDEAGALHVRTAVRGIARP